MLFKNQSISFENLPKVETVAFKPVEKKLKWVFYFRNIIFYTVVFAIVILYQLYGKIDFSKQIYVAIYSILSFFMLLSFLLIELEFPQKKYALRTHDLIYQEGFLFKKIVAVPKNRIQHVEIKQGVLLRVLKLVRISIFTAGGDASDLSIWGLTPEDALQLKEHLSKSIAKYE